MLGEHLTNLDELVRARGTLLLSEVLTRLPTYPLDATAVHFLIGFFCDRIQDYPCVGEVLKGLIAIVRNHPLVENDPELVVRTYENIIEKVWEIEVGIVFMQNIAQNDPFFAHEMSGFLNKRPYFFLLCNFLLYYIL
jgi:hypothetical protein